MTAEIFYRENKDSVRCSKVAEVSVKDLVDLYHKTDRRFSIEISEFLAHKFPAFRKKLIQGLSCMLAMFFEKAVSPDEWETRFGYVPGKKYQHGVISSDQFKFEFRHGKLKLGFHSMLDRNVLFNRVKIYGGWGYEVNLVDCDLIRTRLSASHVLQGSIKGSFIKSGEFYRVKMNDVTLGCNNIDGRVSIYGWDEENTYRCINNNVDIFVQLYGRNVSYSELKPDKRRKVKRYLSNNPEIAQIQLRTAAYFVP